MPSYHIWVRKEDEAAWQAIADKPAWLHTQLQNRTELQAKGINPDKDLVSQVQGNGNFTDEPITEPFEDAA